MGMGLDLSLSLGSGGVNLLAQVLALSPSALYDPSDLTSLYQSRVGVTTGAVDSVVGIMLDKSQMLGLTAADYIAGRANLLTNGDFSSGDLTGWTVINNDATHTFTYSGGAGRYVSDTTTPQLFAAIELPAPTSSSVLYYVSVDVNYAGGSGALRVQGALATQVLSQGRNTFLMYGTDGTITVTFTRNAANVDCTIDNVTVKIVSGKHALAPSDAARPLLRAGYYVDFDGVDDVLNAQIASSLGASCSVYHRTQAGSNVWLDAQTIAAGNYAMSTTDWKRAAIFSFLPSAAQKAIVEAWGAS